MNSKLFLASDLISFQRVFAMDHRVLMAARAACQPVGLLIARVYPDTVVQHVLVSQY